MSEIELNIKKYSHIVKLIEDNNLSEAEKNLLKTIDEKQNEFYPHQLLGFVYTKTGNIEKSLYHYYKSLEINQNNPGLCLSIAKIFENQKKILEANKFYQQGLSINKNYAPLIKSYSNFLIKFGELSKGLSFQYKHFGIIRFNKQDFEII